MAGPGSSQWGQQRGQGLGRGRGVMALTELLLGRADVRGREGGNRQELSVSYSLGSHWMARAWQSSEVVASKLHRTGCKQWPALTAWPAEQCEPVGAPESGLEQLARSSQPVCTSVRLFDGLATGHSLPLPICRVCSGMPAGCSDFCISAAELPHSELPYFYVVFHHYSHTVTGPV